MASGNDKTHYLNTWPTGEDLMGKKPQKAINDAIANHVLDYDDEHYKGGIMPRVIGLEGKWGCGKSNVIRLLSNNEKLKEGYHVLEFDAWSYQEDDYRISLMEHVTAQLKNFHKDKEDMLEDSLKSTLSNQKQEESKFEPHASKLLIGLIITIAFTSLFGFILEKCPDTDYYRMRRAIFLVLPWLVLVIYALFQRKHLDDLLVLFENTFRNGRTTKNTYTRNPSVFDLRRWLDEVSEICGKRLIVVIDNMDRLPEDKLKKLWSMIHTFADNEQPNNVWIVLPYDEQKLKQVINTDYKAFLRKTIPVTIKMGEPIISDVRDVFDGLYKKAFGEDESNLNSIRALFVFKNKNYSIRDIIFFINSMVTAKRQFPDFSQVSIALYVVMEDDIQDNPNKVLLEDCFASKFSPIVPLTDDNRSEVAAMVYHVSKDDAMQVVYANALGNALTGEDSLPINEVNDKKDFYKVLTDYYTNLDGELYEGYIAVLDEVETNAKDEYKQEVKICWQNIIQFYLGYDSMNLPYVSFEHMNKVLERCNDGQKNDMLIKFSHNLFFHGKTTGKIVFDNLEEIDLLINKYRVDRDTVLGEILLTSQNFKEYLDEAKDRYTKYPISFDPIDWVSYCTNKIEESANGFLNLCYMRNDERCDFSPLIAKAEKLIVESSEYRNAYYAYVIYRSFSDKPIKVKPTSGIAMSALNDLFYSLDKDPIFISLKLYYNDSEVVDDELVPQVSEEMLYLMHPLEIFQKCFMDKVESYKKLTKYIVTHKLICDKRLQSNALEFSIPLVDMGIVTRTELEDYINDCFKDADERGLPMGATFM